MKITAVSYSKTYPTGAYANEKIGMEATIDEAYEKATEAINVLKSYCDQIHKTNNPHLYQEQDTIKLDEEVWKQNTSEPLPTNVPILTQEQKFLQLISLATSEKELSIYGKTANNPKYPQLKAAYDQKYSQLTEK